jgi:magnesium transporter
MTVDEAVSFLRRDARDRAQTIYYAYVTDSEERLLGVVTFRDLLLTPGDKTVRDVMRTDVITASADLDQEELNQLLKRYNLQMIPVVDSERRIKRLVTKDNTSEVQQAGS